MRHKKANSTEFPDETTLKRLRDKLSDPHYKSGNIALSPDASKVDRAKYELCQFISKYRRKHALLQRQLAEQIGANESRISDILRGKIDHFTLDRLITYAEKLNPALKIRIVAA